MSKTLAQLLNRKAKKEIGFELELEFNGNPKLKELRESKANIAIIQDHSLRNGYEFIFNNPLTLGEAEYSVPYLCKFLKDNTSAYISPRCSTHIHINLLNCTEIQALNVILLSWYFEDFIQNGVEPYRKENNFCITIKQSDEFIFNLVQHFKNKGTVIDIPANRDYSKYSATNIATMRDIGSIEYRQFEATLDSKKIINWIKNLLAIKKFAMRFESPQELFQYIYENDFEKVAKNALDTPEVFGVPKDFNNRNNNIFYISKVVDHFDEEFNVIKKNKRETEKFPWGNLEGTNREEWVREQMNRIVGGQNIPLTVGLEEDLEDDF